MSGERPRVGDNIFEIMGVVSATLRAAAWPREKIDAVMREIGATQSYDDAIAACRKHITIKDRK